MALGPILSADDRRLLAARLGWEPEMRRDLEADVARGVDVRTAGAPSAWAHLAADWARSSFLSVKGALHASVLLAGARPGDVLADWLFNWSFRRFILSVAARLVTAGVMATLTLQRRSVFTLPGAVGEDDPLRP